MQKYKEQHHKNILETRSFLEPPTLANKERESSVQPSRQKTSIFPLVFHLLKDNNLSLR